MTIRGQQTFVQPSAESLRPADSRCGGCCRRWSLALSDKRSCLLRVCRPLRPLQSQLSWGCFFDLHPVAVMAIAINTAIAKNTFFIPLFFFVKIKLAGMQTCKLACSPSAAYLLQNYNFIIIKSKEYVLNFTLVLSFTVTYLKMLSDR